MTPSSEGSAGMRRHAAGFFAHTSAVIVGDVQVGVGSSFWPFTCARGDVAPIRVGQRVCVQDFTMLHCKFAVPLIIEDDVGIGHHAVVHCARVGTGSLIGIGARVLDDVVVGSECIVAAGAVVPPGSAIPDRTVVAGVPAKALRPLREADLAYIRDIVSRYVDLAAAHADGAFADLLA